MTNFTLHRSGEFTLTTHGQYHCGTKPKFQVRYDLRVTCPVDSLDDRGFLFDQTAIAAFFAAGIKSDRSCELLTVACGRALYKLIKGQNGGCHISRMVLTLSPDPFLADLTFDYSE